MTRAGQPVVVDVLGFAACPNVEPALALVSDPADVDALRFLGSPSIRVDGRDVEPDAGRGRAFSYSCRTYLTEGGRTGVPDERWVRAALVAAPAGGR